MKFLKDMSFPLHVRFMHFAQITHNVYMQHKRKVVPVFNKALRHEDLSYA